MSKTTKRKHVLKENFDNDYGLPKENQSVVKVLSSKGNNLHEVESASGESYLVSMPTKFRKNIWVKRGDYILVEPIIEGGKVKAEIVKILNPQTIKYYHENNVWPERFQDNKEKNEDTDKDNLFVNTNRIALQHYDISESSSTSDDSDEHSS